MSTIGVIDYGMGNLHSLSHALGRAAGEMRVDVSYDPDKLRKADRLILPGVGGVRQCMGELQRLELDDLVKEMVGQVPIMGICLGMQVLLDYSEENNGVDALGVFPGEVRKFVPLERDGEKRKIPHMGWTQVHFTQDHPLWHGVSQDAWFYFVHSYYVHAQQRELVNATMQHGVTADAVIAKDNLFAAQFHPEKSHTVGLQLLKNFLQWNGQCYLFRQSI